jgi:hypothetical protein
VTRFYAVTSPRGTRIKAGSLPMAIEWNAFEKLDSSSYLSVEIT